MEITYSRDGVAIGGGGGAISLCFGFEEEQHERARATGADLLLYTLQRITGAVINRKSLIFASLNNRTLPRRHSLFCTHNRMGETGGQVIVSSTPLSLSSSLLHRTCSVLMTRRILFNPMFLSNRLQVMRLLPLMDAK